MILLPSDARFCPRCGTRREPQMGYCTRCGANLAELEEAIRRGIAEGSGVHLVSRGQGERAVNYKFGTARTNWGPAAPFSTACGLLAQDARHDECLLAGYEIVAVDGAAAYLDEQHEPDAVRKSGKTGRRCISGDTRSPVRSRVTARRAGSSSRAASIYRFFFGFFCSFFIEVPFAMGASFL